MTEQREPGVRLAARLVPIALIVGLVFVLSLVFNNPWPASADDPGKVTICHATGSSTNPFVEITIDKHALPAHLGGPNLNGNGKADHKGHGDILLNPGSINPGSIGHGPISAAECQQLSAGATTPTSTARAGGPTQGAAEATEETAEETPSPASTSGLEKTGQSANPHVSNSPSPPAIHSTEAEHGSAGGGAEPKVVTPLGASVPATSGPQNSLGAGSNANTQRGVGAASDGNAQHGLGGGSNGNSQHGGGPGPNGNSQHGGGSGSQGHPPGGRK